MTIQEFHDNFKFRLDKFDSLNYPNFEDAEIDLILNQAQDTFVKQRYGATNTKKQSFEETQKRTEDLKNIVVRSTIVPAVNAADNINTFSRFVTLPADHWFIVQELTSISYADCHGNTINANVFTKAIQHNDYSKLIDNPFERPDESTVLRLMENDRVELIPASNVTISGYKLTYIKQPIRMNLGTSTTCELSEHTHTEIVDLAVQIALEGIEAKRNQTFTPIVLNNQE